MKNIKKVLFLLVVFLFTTYGVKALTAFNHIKTNQSDYEYNSFFKVKESNDPITDAAFIQKSLDGSVIYEVSNETEEIDRSVIDVLKATRTSEYHYVRAIYNKDEAYNLLTADQKAMIEGKKYQ